MTTTPTKRRPAARKPRAAGAAPAALADAMAAADAAIESVQGGEPLADVGDAAVPVAATGSLLPASIDDAVDDIFQALMADDDGEASAPAKSMAAAPIVEASAKPARKRSSRAKTVEAAATEVERAAASTDAMGAVDAAVAFEPAGTTDAEPSATMSAADATEAVAAPEAPAPKKRAPARKRGKAQAADDLVAAAAADASIVEAPASDAVVAANALNDQSQPRADEVDASQEALTSDAAGADVSASADAHAASSEIVEATEADTSPRGRRKSLRAAIAAASEEPAGPPRFTLGSREDEGVFGDYELRDSETAGTYRLRLLGPALWRCDCAQYAEQGDCDHGEQLLLLFDEAQEDALEAGWPAREAEVWLVPGPERRLQWIAGRAVPAALRDQSDLDERQRRDAEHSQSWLQSLVSQARAAGVTLRVDAPVWPQLGWGRDAQARVERLEAFMADGDAMRGALGDTLPAYQWEAALFAVCAGRALIADDLGLGQRGAAAAAIRLWEQLFGAAPALVIAPEASHAAWRRDLTRWLGQGASKVTLAAQPTAKHAPALLVVDGVDTLSAEALADLRALEARTGAHVLLIAAQEPLGQPGLATWVEWLDTARRGPLARFAALPADAGKRALREALESVVLSRRKRELVDQLPAALLTPLWLEAAGSALPQGPLKQLRQTLERWTARPFLNSGEQQQLMEALALLPPSSRQALAAKAEAVLALRRDWIEAATPAASRLLVCSRSETLLDSLSQSPQLRRLPPHRLRAGDSDEQRAATLQAWRAAPAGVLLASDDALNAMPDALLADDRIGLVHADLPWQADTLAERVALACGDDACGVPAALLMIEGSLDAGLFKAQSQGQAFPDWLDAPPAWLDQVQLQALMGALPKLLEGL